MATSQHERSRDAREGGVGSTSSTSPAEMAVAVLSALLVLGTIVYLLVNAAGPPPTPPAVEVTVEGIRPVGAGYLVEFRAANQGQETAAAVEVEGTLRDGGTPVETSRAMLDYVPAEGSRLGGLYFSEDPRTYDLELRALGYRRP